MGKERGGTVAPPLAEVLADGRPRDIFSFPMLAVNDLCEKNQYVVVEADCISNKMLQINYSLL